MGSKGSKYEGVGMRGGGPRWLFVKNPFWFPCACSSLSTYKCRSAEFILLLKEGLWGLLTCVHKRPPIRKFVPIVCLAPDTSGGKCAPPIG
jgi:hypothetical protein